GSPRNGGPRSVASRRPDEDRGRTCNGRGGTTGDGNRLEGTRSSGGRGPSCRRTHTTDERTQRAAGRSRRETDGPREGADCRNGTDPADGSGASEDGQRPR